MLLSKNFGRQAHNQCGNRTVPILVCVNSGQPCLLRVAPDGQWQPVEGLSDYASSCLGKGTVLLFIEPLLEQPSLCILGGSAVAQSLAEQALHLNFNVSLHVNNELPEAPSKRVDVRSDYECSNANFIVITTQGKGDKKAINAALQSTCPHIRMVVSARKLAALKLQLIEEGVSESSIARVEGPAGIDINAQLPQEIALSVLAEIVKIRRTHQTGASEMSEFIADSPPNAKLKDFESSGGGCCDE